MFVADHYRLTAKDIVSIWIANDADSVSITGGGTSGSISGFNAACVSLLWKWSMIDAAKYQTKISRMTLENGGITSNVSDDDLGSDGQPGTNP